MGCMEDSCDFTVLRELVRFWGYFGKHSKQRALKWGWRNVC